MWTERKLLSAAIALGARHVPGWSSKEQCLVTSVNSLHDSELEYLKGRIAKGHDPLGELFCALRPAVERRDQGAVYTPAEIVAAMIDWAVKQASPARIVDPGTGSGRFLVQAARRFPLTELVGVEIDPVAAILARGHLSAAGFSDRSTIVLDDFRSASVNRIDGQTLFVGNPPYVRHHQIDARWKSWLTASAKALGHQASQLAGLHIYFLLAVAMQAKPGDIGAFITSSEWLDVNYGRLAREMFIGRLGGRSLLIVEPKARPFPDAASTAAIVTFVVDSRPTSIAVRRTNTIHAAMKIDGGRKIKRERLAIEPRWSHFSRVRVEKPMDFVELGELCRVHRGQVTGSNRVWIAGQHSAILPPKFLFPTVTRARELFHAERVLTTTEHLRRVIDLPVELDSLGIDDRERIERFLVVARQMGGHTGYVAKYRKAWWSVGLREPAPILATYMARRPPAFVLNSAYARHINIAHGLYPRATISQKALRALTDFLSNNVSDSEGRTYSGGLTKFEPREMERLVVPNLDLLEAGIAC